MTTTKANNFQPEDDWTWVGEEAGEIHGCPTL